MEVNGDHQIFTKQTPTGLVQLQGLVIHVEYSLRNRNYVAILILKFKGSYTLGAKPLKVCFFPLVESLATPYNSLAPPTVQTFTYILADNLWTE